MITFTLSGEAFQFDNNKLDLEEAMKIKEHTGLTVRMYEVGLSLSDPAALKAMVWLAKNRAGTAIAFEDVTFDCFDLLRNLRSVKPEGDADPNSPDPVMPTGSDNGTTPRVGEPNTSESSPTTSA